MTRFRKKDFEKEITKLSKKPKRNFNVLFILYVLIFIFTLFLSVFLLMSSLSVKQETINYQENGNVDYRVYLNHNDFYESDYLEKNMVYVSSLMNNIAVFFDYNFSTDGNRNVDYSYEIVGEIIIYDSLKENVFFRKDYVLAELAEQKLENTRKFTINKSVNIDYNYYNSLADKFKKSYGVSSKSDFVVKLKLKYKIDDENIGFSENRELSLTVPLSENEVTITTDNSSVRSMPNIILGKRHVVINSQEKFVFSIFLFFVSLCLFVRIITLLLKLKPHNSKYDIFIRKILREYDRLIVDTVTPPSLDERKVITVNSFDELLDVRDNLGIPIMYYIEKEHSKCTFYLNYGREIYVLNITAKDLNKK